MREKNEERELERRKKVKTTLGCLGENEKTLNWIPCPPLFPWSDSNRFKFIYNERGKANQLPVHQEQKTKVPPSSFSRAAVKQRERIYWIVYQEIDLTINNWKNEFAINSLQRNISSSWDYIVLRAKSMGKWYWSKKNVCCYDKSTKFAMDDVMDWY